MIAHELALEAANSEFSDLGSLPYAVTLFQFGFCVLLPLVISKGRALAKFPRNTKDFIPYIRLSIVVFGATALASMSLKYVNYPTKVIFKSAKLIPTMVVATLLQGKRYGTHDYVAALMLCAGAAGYSYGSGGGSKAQSTSWPGLALLLVSIFCDALVPNFQQMLMTKPSDTYESSSKSEEMKELPQYITVDSDMSQEKHAANANETSGTTKQSQGVSAAELMVNVNAIGFVGLSLYMGASGELSAAVATAALHPRLVMYLTMVGVGLSTAVFAYTRLIQASGSVVAVAVATLRKVATVVLSYVVFPKPLLGIHVVSGLLVLGGVVLSTVAKQRPPPSVR